MPPEDDVEIHFVPLLEFVVIEIPPTSFGVPLLGPRPVAFVPVRGILVGLVEYATGSRLIAGKQLPPATPSSCGAAGASGPLIRMLMSNDISLAHQLVAELLDDIRVVRAAGDMSTLVSAIANADFAI